MLERNRTWEVAQHLIDDVADEVFPRMSEAASTRSIRHGGPGIVLAGAGEVTAVSAAARVQVVGWFARSKTRTAASSS